MEESVSVLNDVVKPEVKVMTGSQAVIESMLFAGTEVIFGYPGGAIMPVYDALFLFGKGIRHILTRHEQGAIHAAQGYARATGRTGVCLVTSGPGSTNVVTGIADAMIDSTPVVVISGQVGSSLLGTDAFQETDIRGITQPITKWNYQITRASEIPWAIARAFFIAGSGRPGPVLLEITKDAQFGSVDYLPVEINSLRSYIHSPVIDLTAVDDAVKLINLARKPLLLVGQGVLLGNACDELMALLAKTGIPAAWTLLGMSALPTGHPQNVGMLGMHGNYGPNILTGEADLIIAAGMRFDDRVTSDTRRYASKARIIHLDIDPSEISKVIHADVAVLGDIKESLPLITARVQPAKHEEWLDEFRACSDVEYDRVIRKELNRRGGLITMGEVISRVSKAFNDDALVVTDVGQHQMMAARYSGVRRGRSVITSGGLGTMGFGLPAAIGAGIGRPDRDVVLFVGDGGFQMTIQELGTIFQENVAVKIVLLNNSYLGMVRQWQELFFGSRYSFTELKNPDFGKIADGYSIPSLKVESRELLDTAISKMVESPGPFLLEVVVEKEGNVFPMVPAGGSLSEIRLE